MVWLNPAAAIGLLAAIVPIVIHLLRRQQARRVVLPSVRFVVAADRSAVRMRRVADPLLMIVRASMIASAALAAARPLALTDARLARWSDRIARVVVVDVTESAAAGASASEAAIAAETSSAEPSAVVRTADLRTALRRAAAWLDASPPVRREIVVHSDFSRGGIDADTIAQVPPSIGLRLVRTTAPNAAQHRVIPLLTRNGILEGDVRLESARTSVTYASRPFASAGLRIAGGEPQSIESLLRVVQSAGAFAPSPEQPIVVRFSTQQPAAGDRGSATGSTQTRDWTLGAAMRLLDRIAPLPVRVSVAASDGSLVLDVAADAASLSAAQVLKAALDTRPDPRSTEELETEQIPDATLAGWSRVPAPPDPAQWRQTDESDGRWFWALSLLLLAVETMMRRSKRQAAHEVIPHAA